MQGAGFTAHALNRTRHTSLASRVTIADTHWSRFWGLMRKQAEDFRSGDGLWIVPCHGVHTWWMNFPIDVVYLDKNHFVVHLEADLRPWRLGRVMRNAVSVLELPGGTVQASGTVIGDEIEISKGQATGMTDE